MNIKYKQLSRPYLFASPFADAEVAVLLYINDTTITAEEQELLSDQIVAGGCRYAVCAGYKCSTWDDSIDVADLRRNDWKVRDDNFVMTSWHENETLEDIVSFFLNDTSFDYFTATNMLVLVLGNSKMLEEIKEEINRQLTSNRVRSGD